MHLWNAEQETCYLSAPGASTALAYASPLHVQVGKQYHSDTSLSLSVLHALLMADPISVTQPAAHATHGWCCKGEPEQTCCCFSTCAAPSRYRPFGSANHMRQGTACCRTVSFKETAC